MEQENIRKETFLATLLLLAGTLILWKGYSYEPDSRQFPVFLGWLFVSFSILNAITLFKKFKAEKLSLSFEFHRPGFPLSLTILLLIGTYAVAVPLLGYYLSTFLFLILVMAGFGCIRKRSLLVSRSNASIPYRRLFLLYALARHTIACRRDMGFLGGQLWIFQHFFLLFSKHWNPECWGWFS